MVFDISKFKTLCDFTLKTKSFGDVKIKTLKTSHLIDLEKLLLGSDIDGVSFSRGLLLLLGYKKITSNDESTSEDADESFSKADLELIDDEDLEIFAQEFIMHNRRILNAYHKAENKLDNNEKIERNPGEKNSAYLLRVFKVYLENEKLRLEKITEPFSNYVQDIKDSYKATNLMAGLFGKSLYKEATIDSLRLNINLSDKLKESILGFNKSALTRDSFSDLASQTSFEPVKFPENPIYETNKRLNTLISALESMKPLVSDSAELIRNMNDTAIQMQADFIKNSSENQRYAKWAIWIAVLSLLTTVGLSWLSYKESKEQVLKVEKTEKMMEIYQQDMLDQNAKFEDMVRIINLNAEADSKRHAQHNELLQTLKENAKNSSN